MLSQPDKIADLIVEAHVSVPRGAYRWELASLSSRCKPPCKNRKDAR